MWEHYGKAAIRDGKWKLVRVGMNKSWELYDMEKDRSEVNNLAEQMPDKVEQLSAKWQSEAERTLILPRPGKRR
jgi:arylsulfatase